MGDDGELTEPVLRSLPEPSQLTKDARWMVVIVAICILVQQPGSTWSHDVVHGGRQYSFVSHPSGWISFVTVGIAVVGFVVAIARRGAARFDEHVVMGLALAGVLGVTVLVWLLMPVQMSWVEWAVEHGQTHPFLLGNVTGVHRSADHTG